jgi:ABC-type ATPase involved in cell division
LDPLQNELSNQLMSMLVNQVRQTGMTLIITTAIESILQQFPGRIISAYHAEYAESIN